MLGYKFDRRASKLRTLVALAVVAATVSVSYKLDLTRFRTIGQEYGFGRFYDSKVEKDIRGIRSGDGKRTGFELHAGLGTLGCELDDTIPGLESCTIRGEDLHRYDHLDTGFHTITLPCPRSPDTDIALTGGSSLLNSSCVMDVCVFLNQSRRGLARIMNEVNFRNTQCSGKNPKFSPNHKHHTALASFPRSGNTWTRHLLEYISGIHTGSVYNDVLANGVFKGSLRTDGVIAIKTHSNFRNDRTNFDGAVLLIRPPQESILSFFNYKQTHSHTKNVDQVAFNTTDWQRSVGADTKRWKQFYLSWLNGYRGRMMVLSYTRLRKDFFNELYKLADFLNVNMTYRTLWCAFDQREGEFHRRSNVTMSQVFTQTMLDAIAKAKAEVGERLRKMLGNDADGII